MFTTRLRRYMLLAIVLAAITILLLFTDRAQTFMRENYDKIKLGKPNDGEKLPPKPKYIPQPTWTPPPVVDPFPALATSTPPPVPQWNVPKEDLHQKYGLPYAPPLFIGFTRSWPILLQAVVSYITAGWPASQIYVIENTGVQWANARGKLSLQNPFYLNHDRLKKLGVNIIQTPVLLSFSQLQNFYVHLAHEHEWPHYFWSHMDVLVLSLEDRRDDDGYKTIYESALAELNDTLHSEDHWATRFFAYDSLTLVNREAYDAVGGWDTNIPYYITDCDMHSRLIMQNFSLHERHIGIVNDVATVLSDLAALYRDPEVKVDWVDPNPKPPEEKEGKNKRADDNAQHGSDANAADGNDADAALNYWITLRDMARAMSDYKHGDRGRNTWQGSQLGGQGEPYYYPQRGVQIAFDLLTNVGRKVFEEKWGHGNCDLIGGGGLGFDDQWRVKHDWE